MVYLREALDHSLRLLKFLLDIVCFLAFLVYTFIGSNISSTKSDVNIRLVKAWTAIDNLSFILKSDPSDKIKRDFFQAVTVSCTTWMLIKRKKKKLDGKHKRMLHAILNKSSKQHPTKQQLYGHLPPISKTVLS